MGLEVGGEVVREGRVGFLGVVSGGSGGFAGEVKEGVAREGSRLSGDATELLWKERRLRSKLLKSSGVAADMLCLSGKMDGSRFCSSTGERAVEEG